MTLALHPDFSDLWGSPPALNSTTTLGFFFLMLNLLTCYLRDTMPRHRSSTLIPREAEDSPMGDRHFKHVPPLTYLICLSLITYAGMSYLRAEPSYEAWRMSLTRFELFWRQVGMLEAQRFIRLATKLYRQWMIKALLFYGVETFIWP